MTEPFRQAAASEAFEQLHNEEHGRVWDLVYSQLGFRASTKPEGWPGFAEPVGSGTWSVAPLFDDFASRFVEAEISQWPSISYSVKIRPQSLSTGSILATASSQGSPRYPRRRIRGRFRSFPTGTTTSMSLPTFGSVG